MKTTSIKPKDAVKGDQVVVLLKDDAERSGSVLSNDPEEKRLDVLSENMISFSISYSKIEKILKIEL
jgi:hypothetical protein